MPNQLSLAEQLGHSTVRIEALFPDGKVGTGSGFFYRFAEQDGKHVPAIVTNRHVVEGSLKGGFLITLQDADGNPDCNRHETFSFDNFDSLWHRHSDPSVDLVAMPIAPLHHFAESKSWKFFYVPLDHSLVPTAEEIDDFIGLEPITMVGYPNGLWDKTNNLPLYRRGVLASNYKRDWNGQKEFLIDAACFPGSSGSPVFLYENGGYQTRKGTFLGASRLKILGILYAGPQHTVEGDIRVVTIPIHQKAVSVAGIPNNLGIVIKSERLKDFDTIFKQ